MNSYSHPGFSEAMDPLHHASSPATLGGLQYQSGNTQPETSNIPGVLHYNLNHPPATLPSYPSLHYPPERNMYLNALSILLNRELHMGFPSQHASSFARSFAFPDSHATPPSSTAYSPFTPDDDNLLAEAISRCETDGKNLSVAVAELSGVNEHSTADWINYYIQNSQRIREKMISEPPRSESSEAAPSTLSEFESRSVTQARSRRGKMRQMKLDKVASEELMHPRRIPRGKQAHRYSTAIPNASTLSWPKPPSRIVRLGGGRYRYTNEDIKYMKSFFKTAYKRYPGASRSQIKCMLAAQAPHHSLRSWGKYVFANRDMLERIRHEVARANSDFGVGEGSDEQDAESMQASTSQPTESEEAAPSVGAPDGVKGTRTMKRVANFIASSEDWLSRPQTQMVKWRQFALQHEPQRSAKAWSEFYMTNREDIDRWVRHIIHGKKEANSNEKETCPSSPLDEQLRSSPPLSMVRSVRSGSPEL